MEKLIITVAQTGGVHGKIQNPNLPEQPDEIAQSAYDCWRAGASIVHIHVRDKQGRATSDVEVYRDIHRRIRQKMCDIIIQDTTGGGYAMTLEQRLGSIGADPEMASLNMGILSFRISDFGFDKRGSVLFSNTSEDIEDFARAMLDKGIKPEMEVYNPSMLDDVYNLIDKNLIKKPYYVNFVMNMKAQGGVKGTPKNLMYMVDLLPPDSIFNVCGVGPAQLPLTTLSIILGGMVRVGMEDNLYYTKGVPVKSNAQLVERTVRIARELARDIATPDEARGILGLKKLKL